MVTGSRLTGYIVNVKRSPVIERLMVRGSQVALKHVIHDIDARTLVVELRQCAIKRWVPCGDMNRMLKIPHLAKVDYGFRTTLSYLHGYLKNVLKSYYLLSPPLLIDQCRKNCT